MEKFNLNHLYFLVGIILLIGLQESASAQSIFITPTIKNGFNIGDNNGSISLEVKGGVAPYSYSWVTGETTSTMKDLIAGTYIVQVTDNNNHMATLAIKLNEPEELTISAKSENSTSKIYCNGSIGIEVYGGNAPYSFLWNANIPAAGFLSTTFEANNGSGGIMFDLKAINAINIDGFDVNLNSGNKKVDVYYKSGSYRGFENDKNKWIKEGAYNVKSEGAGIPTHISLSTKLSANAGEAISFFISSPNSGLKYCTGEAPGSQYRSDHNIQIYEGIGRGSNLFNSAIFSGRKFSGRVYYIATGNSTSTAKDLRNLCEGTYALIVTDASGYSASSSCFIMNDYDSVEIFSNEIAEPTSFHFNDPICNATSRYTIEQLNSTGFIKMVAYPNPSNGLVNVGFEVEDEIQAEILLVDLTGRQMFHKKVSMFSGYNEMDLNLSHLSKGVYMLKGTWGNKFETIRLVNN